MKISSVIAHKGDFVATVAPEDTVWSLLGTLAEYKIGAVVVSSDGNAIAGIASERDIVRALQEQDASILDSPVSEIMSKIVATCTPDSTVEELMVQMTEQRVRHIPVIADGNLVGIVSIGDVVKARIELLEDERKSLVSYITS